MRALGGERDGDLWRLESQAVAREVARGVFRRRQLEQKEGGGVRVGVDDFTIEWAMGMPASLTCPPLELLRGIALREDGPDPALPSRAATYPCFLFLSLDDMPAHDCEVGTPILPSVYCGQL